MPPRPVLKPEFSIYGRYLLNVDERKVPGPTYFHDGDNLTDICGLKTVPTNSISRFNNVQWAISRGYDKCKECKP